MKPTAVIVSDVHLGSRHCLHEAFLRFLDELPDEATLILNGDIDDDRPRPRQFAPEKRLAVLARLREESSRRPLVWVRGNHDATIEMPDPGAIRYCREYGLDRRLYIAHGHAFDALKPRGGPVLWIFRAVHRLRIALGAECVHVARYAKRYAGLYRILRRHVARRAVAHARRAGYDAVTCGHTHYAEDTVVDGVRYINTGAWTEYPAYALLVDDKTMTLKMTVTEEGGSL